MSIDEARKNILDSDEFVLEEFRRVQVLFEMKKVIRYHHNREEIIDTESVAEHVYGMHILAQYFIPLEDVKGEWDKLKILDMALLHDIDEIETGDTIGYMKTQEQKQLEHEAQKRVIERLPQSLQSLATNLLEEYETQKTPEARFVKALDKIEPVFHLLNENGKKVFYSNKTTEEQHRSIKELFVSPFPCIKRFNEVAIGYMREHKFYYQ